MNLVAVPVLCASEQMLFAFLNKQPQLADMRFHQVAVLEFYFDPLVMF